MYVCVFVQLVLAENVAVMVQVEPSAGKLVKLYVRGLLPVAGKLTLPPQELVMSNVPVVGAPVYTMLPLNE